MAINYEMSLEACVYAIRTAVEACFKEIIDPALKEMEVDAINEVVYGAGNPTMYGRRCESGGLSDIKNMNEVISPSDNGVRYILTNDTEFNPNIQRRIENKVGDMEYVDTLSRNSGTGLALLVEYGQGGGGYRYDFSSTFKPQSEGDMAWWQYPRPFTQRVVDELNGSKDHVLAIQSYLHDFGFKTKY